MRAVKTVYKKIKIHAISMVLIYPKLNFLHFLYSPYIIVQNCENTSVVEYISLIFMEIGFHNKRVVFDL